MNYVQRLGAGHGRGRLKAPGLWIVAVLVIAVMGYIMVYPSRSASAGRDAPYPAMAPFGVTGEVDQSWPLPERLDHSAIIDTEIATDVETTGRSVGAYGP